MTDTIIDDDIIEIKKQTTSGTNSSITTTRRPMYIETEVRTDTITKRRTGSSTATGSRSVYDVLENTKSPTDGLPPTTYTYAHSVSYMPVTQNGSYDVPVMARRDLRGDYRSYGSTSFSGGNSVFSSPARIINNVRSQLANGYSAIRDRLTHQSTEQQQTETTTTGVNSPTSHGRTRFSRTSSQSSTNGQTTGYNLRRRPPVHSTPRDNDVEQNQRKTTTKQRQDRKTQDDYDDDDEDVAGDDEFDHQRQTKTYRTTKYHDNSIEGFAEKIYHSLINFFSYIWDKLISLPWWLLIPLLLLLGLFVFPYFICKPFEHYPESFIHKYCQDFHHYTNDVRNGSLNFIREHTFDRGYNNLKRLYHSLIDIKDSILNSFDDLYAKIKRTFRRKIVDVKDRVEATKDDAKEYCDAGVEKVRKLIDEFKLEKEKYLGRRHALKPEQEKEFEMIIRQLIDEYSADETGQADYALEANGGKIVDTKCTEYTDEPRQNVVKFLGIPIVHMSKQPDIMIKAGRMPGQCFPFKGDHGSVVIKLAVPVRPTEFVLEHLSKSISIVGHINSAPKNFTVYALKDKHDKEGMVLGRYFYDAENGPSLQRFKPQIVNVPIVEFIEVRVTSNWGNPNYTCLYRFRLHGDPHSIQPSAPPAA